MSGDTHPDQDNPTKYIRLAAILRGQIENGTLPPGGPVPSITDLCAEYGWARQTCGHALRLLEQEGLLLRYPGLGYYVARKGTARDE